MTILEFTLVTFGILLFAIIDYIMFSTDSQRWNWFKKRNRIQKGIIFFSIFLTLVFVNYLTTF
ncbi:hypothetical protein CUC15_13995 [Oceanobacillus zhaokaii]|uniref:Uncharacterized protein n=1 Tax=Oceanobacillus zhaokaii TaxID=2052660 RepID=A0A345PIY7_9BACI|nr:hypothetical protein CUC15_13995 [Oceanobacillus zhaokaii]